MQSNVPRVFSSFGILRLLLAYYSGLLPFIPLRDQQCSLPTPNLKKLKLSLLSI